MIDLKNNKCILVYGLDNAEIVELTKRKINYIIINNNMTNLKIKDILDGSKDGESIKGTKGEKVILFNGFDDEKLQKSIKEIRSFIKGGILAVVTETSKEWLFIDLLNHLIEERNWFNSSK